MLDPKILEEAIKNKDATKIVKLINDFNLSIVDDKIIAEKKEIKLFEEYWHKRQEVKKLKLNGSYGSLLSPSCRFFDQRLGQSTTLSGRQIVKHMSANVNSHITGKSDYLGESIYYNDTDSVYFSAYQTLKKDIDNGSLEWDKEIAVKLYDQICELVNESFSQFMYDAFHCPKSRGSIIKAGREIVATTALFITKKRYAALVYDKEGKRKDTDGLPGEIKVTGLDIRRSDTPVFIQKFLSKLLDMVLNDVLEKHVLEHIIEFRVKFKERPGWEKGSPKRANKITYYQNKELEEGKARLPGHVRASINWNTLRRMNSDKYSTSIADGSKVIVCKLKNNPMGITSIAYPVDELRLPAWFKELPFDHAAMETAIIDKKLKNLIGVLDFDLASTDRSNTFDSLFEF
jgi:DNA polymerase elongation subunit (family B)